MTVEHAQLDPADDHPYLGDIDPLSLWAEAQQWNLVDAAGNGVIYHICTMPHQIHLRDNVLAITLADGTVYTTKVVGPSSHPEQFGVDFLHARTVEPFKRWKIHLDGAVQKVNPDVSTVGFLPDGPHVPARIDLELTAAHPVWIPGERPGDDRDSLFNTDYVFHHEQPFRATGTIEVDGVTVAIDDAVGHRDHSRGARTAVYDPMTDQHRVQFSFWMNGIFESGWAFGTMEGVFDPGGRFERSAIFTAGRHHPGGGRHLGAPDFDCRRTHRLPDQSPRRRRHHSHRQHSLHERRQLHGCRTIRVLPWRGPLGPEQLRLGDVLRRARMRRRTRIRVRRSLDTRPAASTRPHEPTRTVASRR